MTTKVQTTTKPPAKAAQKQPDPPEPIKQILADEAAKEAEREAHEKVKQADDLSQAAREEAKVAEAPPPTQQTPPEEPAEQAASDAIVLAAGLDPADVNLIHELHRLMQPLTIMDLKVRHAMGLVLKKGYFSSDEKRQEHGRKVMKAAELRLGISVSDLYRLVKYVEKYPDYVKFRHQFPDATWSKVKDDLIPDKPKQPKDAWSGRLKRLHDILDLLLKDHAELEENLAPKALKTLCEKLAKVSEVIGTQPAPGEAVEEPATT
jgi:hypothetical protein